MELRPSTNALTRRLHGRNVRRTLARSTDTLERGATVVVSHYNTPDLLAVCLQQTLANSSDELRRIIVVDNASDDFSLEQLGIDDPRIEVVVLEQNLGHQWALECGFWRARTDVVVALDSDAWPIRSDWLEVLRRELDSGAAAVGAWHHNKDYLHPSFAALKTEVIRRHRLSALKTLPRPGAQRGGMRELDVLQHMSWKLLRLGYRVTRLQPVEPVAPMPEIGSTYGDIGFHLWWGTATATRADMTTQRLARVEQVTAAWGALVPFDLSAAR